MKSPGIKITVMAAVALAVFVPRPVMAGKLRIFVSIPPQEYFVQQIGKDRVDINVMVRPGANPATYEPKPVQMASLADAKIFFTIGVPYERVWLKRITASSPELEIVATDQGIRKIPMPSHLHQETEGHEKGDQTHHSDALDPHIWTAPLLVIHQVRIILTALQKADPDNNALYSRNAREFIDALNRLDTELAALFAGHQGAAFLTFHPSWGYFAHRYGLKQVAIEMEGKSPKPAQLQELIAYARKQQIKAVFVQPQFSIKSAQLIAGAIGAQVIQADPLAADWEENLHLQARKFKAALR